MTEKSLMPSILIANVLGIGVAVRVRISTSDLSSLNFSFCNVPNFCSSSYIINPKFLNFNLSLNNACVPIRMSIFPSAQSLKICFLSFCDTKRDTSAILILNMLNLFKKLL